MPNSPVEQGYLHKLSGSSITRSWKRRYFKLYSDKLVYYKDHTSRNPNGEYDLRVLSNIRQEPSNKRPFTFRLSHDNLDNTKSPSKPFYSIDSSASSDFNSSRPSSSNSTNRHSMFYQSNHLNPTSNLDVIGKISPTRIYNLDHHSNHSSKSLILSADSDLDMLRWIHNIQKIQIQLNQFPLDSQNIVDVMLSRLDSYISTPTSATPSLIDSRQTSYESLRTNTTKSSFGMFPRSPSIASSSISNLSNLSTPISNLSTPTSNLSTPISNLSTPISNLSTPISSTFLDYNEKSINQHQIYQKDSILPVSVIRTMSYPHGSSPLQETDFLSETEFSSSTLQFNDDSRTPRHSFIEYSRNDSTESILLDLDQSISSQSQQSNSTNSLANKARRTSMSIISVITQGLSNTQDTNLKRRKTLMSNLNSSVHNLPSLPISNKRDSTITIKGLR